MPPLTYPEISFNKGTFTIFTGPSHLLSEALNNYLVRQNGSILSLSGNVPVILSRTRTNTTQWNRKTVTHAHQLLTTLEKSTQPLILIEHDRTLFDQDADLIRPIALICRRKVSEKGTVFIFGTRPDGWLNKFEPFAHKMVHIEEQIHDATKTKTTIRSPYRQCTLQSVI